MYNKIILAGNLTRDIEMKFSQNSLAIAKTGLATNRKFNQDGERKEEVCFVDITFFGKSAEIANQYLKRGSKILIEGRLQLEQWTDQNGAKRSKHSIVVESMQMLDSANSSLEQTPVPQKQTAQETKQPGDDDNHTMFEEDDIPF